VKLMTDIHNPPQATALAEPKPGYRYRLWSYVILDNNYYYASARSVRNITFNDTEDRNVKIRVFLNLGMNVDRQSLNSRESYAQAQLKAILHDLTTGETSLLWEYHIDVSGRGSHNTEYKQDGCRDAYGLMNATLKAGHQYELILESRSDVDKKKDNDNRRVWQAASDLLVTGVYLEITP